MDNAEIKKIIRRKVRQYIKILRENNIEILRAYLFGSYAKGKHNAESDIDIAIFLNKEKIDGFEEDMKLLRLRRKVDLKIEPHSFSLSDFKKPDPFIKEIVSTGKRFL
jgi:uncharacterized protein